jgi:hypothetical protein
LRHLGQRGSVSDSMTYMRQRGQAATTMEVASGLSDHCSPSPCSRSPSDDRHELGDDSSSDDAAALAPRRGGGGGDRLRFSFRSRPLPPLRPRLILEMSMSLSSVEWRPTRDQTNKHPGRLQVHEPCAKVSYWSIQLLTLIPAGIL